MNITIVPVGMLGTNCYIVESQVKNCIIIDPGAQADKIANIVDKAGLTPTMILLTHGHHDHIGGVNKLRKRYDGIPVHIGENDHDLLEDTSKSLASLRNENADEFIVRQAGTLKGGQELTLDELTIRVVATPGHTKGGVTYLCGNAMFSGDTLFAGDVGRTDLYGGNYDTLKASLKTLAMLEGNYQVYPGHGPATTLEHERKTNPYIEV